MKGYHGKAVSFHRYTDLWHVIGKSSCVIRGFDLMVVCVCARCCLLGLNDHVKREVH